MYDSSQEHFFQTQIQVVTGTIIHEGVNPKFTKEGSNRKHEGLHEHIKGVWSEIILIIGNAIETSEDLRLSKQNVTKLIKWINL